MKKYFYTLFMLCGFALNGFSVPSPSAELDNFDDGDNYTMQGLYPIMQAKPIKYAYRVIPSAQAQIFEATDDPLKKQIAQQTAQNNYREIIENNLKAWPLQTAQFIKKAGRTEEFADLLPLLDGVKVEQVTSRDQADVIFTFSDMAYIHAAPGGKGACGLSSDFSLGRPVEINVLDPNLDISNSLDICYYDRFKTAYDLTDRISLHEIGHYYALAEQYDTSNASVLYSDSDRINRNSIMGASYGKQLSCDDADGFIKIADRTFYKINGKYNARDNQGWQSFCNDGTIYKQGKVQNRTPYFAKWKIYHYDEEGNISAVIDKFPFMISAEDTVVSDAQTGRIQKVTDRQHNVYIVYGYHLTDEHPSISAGLYSLTDNEEKLSREFYKNRSGNFWEIDRFKLFIKPDKCHFVYKGGIDMDVYVDKATSSLEWHFAWGSEGEKYVRIRKYDYKGDNYKCEYTFSKGPNSRAEDVFWRYVLEYNDAQKDFVLLEGKMSKTQREKYWPYLIDGCGKETEKFSSLDRTHFVSTCRFLSAADPLRATLN